MVKSFRWWAHKQDFEKVNYEGTNTSACKVKLIGGNYANYCISYYSYYFTYDSCSSGDVWKFNDDGSVTNYNGEYLSDQEGFGSDKCITNYYVTASKDPVYNCIKVRSE